MAYQDKKEEQIKKPEVPVEAEGAQPEKHAVPVPERRETFADEKIISDELKREIELMGVDEKLRGEAEKKAQKISFLGEKEKIEHLLRIAREKGVVFAIQVAKRMNDPYLLDVFHDILAKEGFFKDFAK